MNLNFAASGQAKAAQTQAFGSEAFDKNDATVLRWLGNSGLHINSHGVNIMVDPVLEDFDMPLLIDTPLKTTQIPHLDALLITHDDGDHFNQTFLKQIAGKVDVCHAPHFVAGLMANQGLPVKGHDIGDSFAIDQIQVKLTPAWHNWKSENPKYGRIYELEDLCGFYIETQDGKLWIPGDSKALPEHYQLPAPDAIFFDWSDNYWHIGFINAVKLANTYPKADLICQHWGSVDAPTWNTFNMNPADLLGKVDNPERIRVLAPGEPFELLRKQEIII